MITIVGQNGQSIDKALQDVIAKAKSALLKSAKYSIRNALVNTTRNHFKAIYPGSTHYSPDKVTEGSAVSTQNYAAATANIDVPGVTRAYHDINILPKTKKYLTIPMHRLAYGKKASDFTDTFVLTKKNGNKFIAQASKSALTFLYYLADHAFQRQDTRLMPSDDVFAENILARIKADLSRN